MLSGARDSVLFSCGVVEKNIGLCCSANDDER